MNMPPWASFYQRSTYAELPDADLPNLPRELNPYERFWVRFAFADLKVLTIFLVAAAVMTPEVILWRLAETHPWVEWILLFGPSALLAAFLCLRKLRRCLTR